MRDIELVLEPVGGSEKLSARLSMNRRTGSVGPVVLIHRWKEDFVLSLLFIHGGAQVRIIFFFALRLLLIE